MDSSADKSIDNASSHTFVGPVNAPSFANFLASSRRFLAVPIIGSIPSFPVVCVVHTSADGDKTYGYDRDKRDQT
ncbi:hypothetical protein PI124_g7544 [Phytophthora idaei]|nr:hypothetical protein PI126_g22906 [Phytophthora idaei]KAG3247765.1 hypothetical protein PI124_g7544 [Phytophthora idaei]